MFSVKKKQIVGGYYYEKQMVYCYACFTGASISVLFELPLL